MKRFSPALAILALAILSCAIPVGNPLPTQGASTSTALAIPSKTPRQLPTQTKAALAIVTASQALHVRAAPGYKSEIVDYLYLDDEVVLTGKCSDGWAQIRWKDGTAWVNARFLSDNSCVEEK